MAKHLLNEEVASRSMKLLEGVEKHPGCLGTMYGICADYKNVTRNKTFYSRKLWENVFNNELVKEALKDRLLFGELGHPADRLETDLTKACIVMTDYEFDDNEQVVKGRFDILDTPSGRILKSFLDYGCTVGLSSRGEGDITTEDGVDRVDEDTYYFVGYDAVALPSVKKAKPALVESVQHKSLRESIQKEVDNSTTVSQLDTIKGVLKATNLPEVDSLMESIDIKSKELSESTTSTEDTVLLEDLETANNRVKELEVQVGSLNEDVTTSKLSLQRAAESNRRLLDKIKGIRRSFSDLETKYSNMVFESVSTSKKIKTLEEALKQKESRIKELTSEVRTTRSSNLKINNEVRSLSEALREADHKCKESDKKLLSALNEAKSKDEEIKGLKESVKAFSSREKSNMSKFDFLKAKHSELLSSYVATKAKISGIDPKELMESVKPEFTSSEVDKLVESIADRNDRYSSLKITKDTLLSSYDPSKVRLSSNQRVGSEKDQESVSFLQQTLGKTL